MRLLFFSFANYISLSQKRIASDVAEVLAKPRLGIRWQRVPYFRRTCRASTRSPQIHLLMKALVELLFSGRKRSNGAGFDARVCTFMPELSPIPPRFEDFSCASTIWYQSLTCFRRARQ